MKLRKRKLRIFETSTIYKSFFSIFSFLSILALSLYSLFNINPRSYQSDNIKKIAWVFSILFVVWYGGSFLNYNLHVSKNDKLLSYFFATLLNVYLVIFVILNIDDTYKGWSNITDLFWWIIPIFIYDIFWKIGISVIEYKTRPFFIRKFIANSVLASTIYIISALVWWSLNEYLVEGKEYDYLYWKNVLVWLTGGWLIITSLIILIYIHYRLSAFGIVEDLINKQNSACNIYIWFSSVTIWALYNFGSSDWNYKEFILVAIAAVMIVAILIALRKKLYQKKDRLLLIVSVLALLIVNTTSFFFVNLWDSTLYENLITFSIFMLFFQLAIVVISIKLPFGFIFLNAILALVLVAQIVLGLAGNFIIGRVDIEEINEIMIIASLTISSLLALTTLVSQFKIAFTIHKYINKIVKLKESRDKKPILKGAQNVR